MLLPDALCGIASVILLHDAVRRTLGHREITTGRELSHAPYEDAEAREQNQRTEQVRIEKRFADAANQPRPHAPGDLRTHFVTTP